MKLLRPRNFATEACEEFHAGRYLGTKLAGVFKYLSAAYVDPVRVAMNQAAVKQSEKDTAKFVLADALRKG
eukprot:11051986-Prorocentrum_lima.AAC.1